jgi:hypothetical protein
LSRAVPKSSHREFVEKVEEMLDQLTGPLVLICGQNIVEAAAAPKDKELVSHINSHNSTCSHVMIDSDGCSS